MVWGFKKKQLPWKLAYTYIDQGRTVSIYERFGHKAQAEQQFTVRRRYHARLLQPIVQAHLSGPDGFQEDLLPVVLANVWPPL